MTMDMDSIDKKSTKPNEKQKGDHNNNKNNNKNVDYFQPPLTSTTQYLRRFGQVYLGHLDTFLVITLVTALPVLLLQNNSGDDWFVLSRWFIRYVVLPLAWLTAEGAAMIATALIYLSSSCGSSSGNDNNNNSYQIQPAISWKKALRIGFQKHLLGRWVLRAVSQNTLMWYALAPSGMLAFSSHILLLDPHHHQYGGISSLVGAMLKSMRLVLFRSPGTTLTTLFFTFGLSPFLNWALKKVFYQLFLPSTAKSIQEDDAEPNNKLDDNGSLSFMQQPSTTAIIFDVIALPFTTCLWTILYINICIQRKPGYNITRESLAKELQVPSQLAAAKVH